MGLVNTGIKSTPCVLWNILLYYWCCGPIFLLEVLDILFRHMASWILSIPTDKNQQVTDSVRNLIMGHVWIFQPYNNLNTNLKTTHKWVTEHKTMLLLWPLQSWDLNPGENEWVNWREEALTWSWIWIIWSDSGWRNDLWSLVRCSLTSSGIIGEMLEMLNWQMEVSKSIE